MTTSIVLVILVTSLATYLSRFLGVVSSEKIKENSKIFRWFKKDFTDQSGTIQSYIYQFLENQDERVLGYKIKYLRYSWLLNSLN